MDPCSTRPIPAWGTVGVVVYVDVSGVGPRSCGDVSLRGTAARSAHSTSGDFRLGVFFALTAALLLVTRIGFRTHD